jgi:branched-chain amino acid transport system substrate-binding protein
MKGITTDEITYKDRGGVPIKRMAVVEVKDGKFSLVERILPDYVPAP